jgi:hypothetical protein
VEANITFYYFHIMARNTKGLPVSFAAKSLLAGAGSILNLSGESGSKFAHSPMARQDRDCRSMASDWKRVGSDINGSMNKILERNSVLRKGK